MEAGFRKKLGLIIVVLKKNIPKQMCLKAASVKRSFP